MEIKKKNASCTAIPTGEEKRQNDKGEMEGIRIPERLRASAALKKKILINAQERLKREFPLETGGGGRVLKQSAIFAHRGTLRRRLLRHASR